MSEMYKSSKNALIGAYKSLLPVAVYYGYDDRGDDTEYDAYNVAELATWVCVLSDYIAVAADREWLLNNPAPYGGEIDDARWLAELDAKLEPYKRK